MKVYGDIEHVTLATGERFRRVTGDGESRLVPELARELAVTWPEDANFIETCMRRALEITGLAVIPDERRNQPMTWTKHFGGKPSELKAEIAAAELDP